MQLVFLMEADVNRHIVIFCLSVTLHAAGPQLRCWFFFAISVKILMKLVPSTTCDVKTWKISALSSLSAGLGFLPHPVCCFGTGGCGASVLFCYS